ncbi:MAG: serine/threonine protein kinase [Polyangiaceae bacterium]|nr:serine/threonine protein kinase [Polyangiaceae bacterium]
MLILLVVGVAAVVYSAIRRRRELLALPPSRLGPYKIGKKLGEGGMGAVFEARHDCLGRRTALKLIKPARRDPDSEARFDREARLTSELVHPNTVALYEYGRTEDGVRYYAMELVEGLTLSELVRREGPLPSGRVLGILRQIAASLAHAHARGLVHRDIKPSNVMLCHREGHPDCVKVVDFGLAKRMDAIDAAASLAGMQVGTPEFMAPEAVDDPASVGPETDVYATGILAYALLTGSTPFEGCDLAQMVRAHRLVPPLPPSARRAEDMPRDLERVVLTCLAKRPLDRFADGAALLEALDACSPIASWSAEHAERWWRALDLEGRGASPARDPAPTTRRDRLLLSSTFPLRRRATSSG